MVYCGRVLFVSNNVICFLSAGALCIGFFLPFFLYLFVKFIVMSNPQFSDSTTHLYTLAKHVFSKFTALCGGNEYEMSIKLHERFTVDDFAFHDDMYYHGIYKYFTDVVIPHKIQVYKAGMELLSARKMSTILNPSEQEVFVRNLWLHDLSKFSANESFGYAMHNFKEPNPKTQPGFEMAWHHHKMNNPHHPEYWMNPNRSGKMEHILMPELYIVEMIADWIGAGRTYGSTLLQWLPANLPKFNFGPSLNSVKEILEKLTGFETIIGLAEFAPGLPEKNHQILQVK